MVRQSTATTCALVGLAGTVVAVCQHLQGDASALAVYGLGVLHGALVVLLVGWLSARGGSASAALPRLKAAGASEEAAGAFQAARKQVEAGRHEDGAGAGAPGPAPEGQAPQGTVRGARWEDMGGIAWQDGEAVDSEALWRIPAEQMKLSLERKSDAAFDHIVPLAPAAVDVLRAVRRLSAGATGCILVLPAIACGAVSRRCAIAGFYSKSQQCFTGELARDPG